MPTDHDLEPDAVTKRTSQLRRQAADLRKEALDRWEDLEDELPVDVDEVTTYARTGVHKARIGLWEVVRIVGELLLVVPRAVVHGLGLLGDVVDDLADRGAVVSERVRDAADAVPPSRRGRRRQVRQRLVWVVVGFFGGLSVGWALASRRAPLVTYESPQSLEGPAGELGTVDELADDATADPAAVGDEAVEEDTT